MEFVKITSAQNEMVKHIIKLRDRRPREKEQLTVLEGYRELTRAREYGMELVECCFSPSHFLGENEYPLLEALASEGVRVVEVAPNLLEKMAYRERPEGLIAIAKMKRHTLADLPLRPNGLYLVAEAFALSGIATQWEHEAGGQVAVVAGDEGAVVVEQGGEQGLGDGDVPVVEQHHPDVFYGNGALGMLFPG